MSTSGSSIATPCSSVELRSCSGLTPSEFSRLNAYLGVSFSMTKYFSLARMRDYVEWAGSHVDRLIILVADQFEVYNLRVFRGFTVEEARARALKVGTDLVRGYQRVIPADLASRSSVQLISSFLADPFYVSLIDFTKRVAAENPEFREDCRNAVLQLLLGKLAEHGLTHEKLPPTLDLLQNYMHEEIALILYVAHVHKPRYPLAVFPFPPRAVLTRLYSGAYGGAFLPYTGSEPFRLALVGPRESVRGAGESL
jgi:tRNA-dependent cyclodipeptide synthase